MSVSLLNQAKLFISSSDRRVRLFCQGNALEKLSWPGTNLEGIFFSRKEILDWIFAFSPSWYHWQPDQSQGHLKIELIFCLPLFSGHLMRTLGSTPKFSLNLCHQSPVGWHYWWHFHQHYMCQMHDLRQCLMSNTCHALFSYSGFLLISSICSLFSPVLLVYHCIGLKKMLLVINLECSPSWKVHLKERNQSKWMLSYLSWYNSMAYL